MDLLNNSKITAGLAMLFLNIGAKYVQADLGKFHDIILSNEYFKKVIVFCLFFMATRDVAVAFLLTIFYIIVIDGMLHEKRKFCIIPKTFVESKINPSEYERAKQIISDYESSEKPVVKDKESYANYLSNLSHLN